MERNLSRAPLHEVETTFQRWSNHDAPDGERFAMVPGTLGLLLQKGYSVGGWSPRLKEEPVLELDRYRILLVPAEYGQIRPTHRVPQDAAMDGVVTLTWKELIAQVKRELGQATASRRNDIVEFGDVRVDLFSHEVWRSNRPLRLSAMEFKMLKFFVMHPLKVISRDEFLNEVWGYNNYPCTRTVDNHVLRLRRRVEPDPSNPVFFQTVPGFGYRFAPLGDSGFEAA